MDLWYQSGTVFTRKKAELAIVLFRENRKCVRLRGFLDYGEAILHVIDTFPPASMVETPPSLGQRVE